MKTTTNLLLVCSLVFSMTTVAQNETQVQELLTRLKTNHMGSINEVFSLEELEQLQQHFSENTTTLPREATLVTRRHSSTKGNTPVSVVTINPVKITTEIHGLSPLTQFEGAGVARFSPENNCYIIDNENRLHIRGVTSTNYSDVGVISNITPGQSITGAEIMSNGSIYIIGTNGVDNSSLYMLDPDMVTALPIGGNNGLTVPINLVRDGADNLFTIDVDDDNTYGIDKTTGAVSFIGSAGYDANFGQGAAYDPIAGALLLSAFNADVGDTELRELNPNTGQTLLLGTITPGTVDQYGWQGYYDADLLNSGELKLENITIYPNPAHSKLFIVAENIIEEVTIFDVRGQQVMNTTLNAVSGELSIELLANGLYLIRVKSGYKTTTTKFVKNK